MQLSRSTDYYIYVIKEAYIQASNETIIGKSESDLRLYETVSTRLMYLKMTKH